VFDSDCVSLRRTIIQSGDTVAVRFNAPTAGTYFISITYNSASFSGEPLPGPGTTVHYDFMTTGVPDSTSGLDLLRHSSTWNVNTPRAHRTRGMGLSQVRDMSSEEFP
jgi:hypothetical protein